EDVETALDAWRRLLAGLHQGSADWYEARYHSLRLLWQTDPDTAREVMTQHRLLHPDFGPDPWGQRLRDLNAQMADTPEPQEKPDEDRIGLDASMPPASMPLLKSTRSAKASADA